MYNIFSIKVAVFPQVPAQPGGMVSVTVGLVTEEERLFQATFIQLPDPITVPPNAVQL